MLPPDCHWLETDNGVSLRRRYGCVAFIVREEHGVRVVIQWGERALYSRAGSLEQGKRWMAARAHAKHPAA